MSVCCFWFGKVTSARILCLLAGLLTAAAAAAAPSPLVRLPLDEGKGEVAADASGHGLDARLVNATWEVFGVSGAAVRLCGDKSYLEFPRDPRLLSLSNATYSVWVKAARPDGAMALFSRGGYARGWAAYLARSYLGLSSRNGQPGRSTQAICYRQNPFGADAVAPFVHYAIVLRTSRETDYRTVVTYYVDGKRVSGRNAQSDFPLTCAISAEASEPLTFGQRTSASSRQFEGLVDEIAVFDRALDDDEVAALQTAPKRCPSAVRAVREVRLAKLDLPPLKRTRLAVYFPPDEPWMPKPVRDFAWFEEAARRLGCTLRRLADDEVTDTNVLSAANFDTLVLPAAAMPFACEDSVFRFLAAGGTLLTRSAVPATFRRNREGGFDRWDGKQRLKSHAKGWYAPFLLRENPAKSALRTFETPLGLAQGAHPLTGDLLPAELEPVKGIRYRPLENWNKSAAADGGACDGFNYPLAPDCDFPVYREANGVGSDFCVHRYHNLLVDGGTLVQLGDIGSHLLSGRDGEKAFEAALRLAEARLPGEHTPEYCRAAADLHRAWSDFCFTYLDVVADLRDAALLAQTRGRDWAAFVASVGSVERRFAALEKDRTAQQALLFADREADRALNATRKLLKDVADASGEFRRLRQEAEKLLATARRPTLKPVRHRYGTVPSVASFVVPVSLSRLRGRLFGTLRRMGVNVYSSSPFPGWYAEDEEVRRQMDGFLRDFKAVYGAGARFSVGGGAINPASAKVTDAPLVVYPTNAVREEISARLRDFAWMGTNRHFRIGTADETGYGYGFWGRQAADDFRRRLKARFGTAERMNARCGTDVPSLETLQLPVRAPTTRPEHALWELWRRCREDKLCEHYRTFRALVKEQAPGLDVCTLPSTGSFASPLYGVDFYRISQDEDVRSPDGTCCTDEKEWIYADLSDGKRFLTGEWGGLYMEAPLQNLYGKLWQELAVGSWGVEQHIVSFGSDVRNTVDALDLPTKYGALMAKVAADMRRYDPIVLDGRRADPEVLVLYSQTSRAHDQAWGFGGEKTFSPHAYAVSAYYRLFLEFGHSARVLDEGALAARPVPSAAVLVVPQAAYLSETVQRRLLDWAAAGGRLVLEGRCGAYDEFGRDSRLLFRTAKLSEEESDMPVTAAFGKGSVTFLGRDLGLEKDPAFAHVVERTLRGFGLSERFAVSDPRRRLREWTYDGETYLFLVSREGRAGEDWGIGEVEIAVRGDVRLEDQLFGEPVRARNENGYTVFRTLAVNGAHVFRVTGGRIAAADDRLARSRPPQYPDPDRTSASASDVREVALPYEGQIFDVTALKSGDATFSLTTVATGSRQDNGETYLTVTCGGLRARRRIEAGGTYFIPVRGRTFKVFCRENFQMFPFYSVVRIEEADRVPPSAAPQASRDGDAVRLDNGLLSLEIDVGHGGNLKSVRLCDDRFEQLANGLAHLLSGARPGPFLGHALSARTSVGADGACADLALPGSAQGLSFSQRMTLAPDAAAVRVSATARNATSSPRRFDLRFHPELALGGAADTADVFAVPEEDGVRRLAYRALGAGTAFHPAAGWAALVDSRERLALVTEFDPKAVRTVYVWEADAFYTFELLTAKDEVLPGDGRTLDFTWRFCRGLTGVDAVKGPVVAHLEIPSRRRGRRSDPVVLQIATDRREPVGIRYEVILSSGNGGRRTLAKGTDGVSFELPLNVELGTAGGADRLIASIDGPGGELKFERACSEGE